MALVAHDAEFHSGNHRRAREAAAGDQTLGVAGASFLAHVEALAKLGNRSEATLRDYRDRVKRLLNVFGIHRKLGSIDRAACRWYVTQRATGKGLGVGKESRTRGDAIVNELQLLEKIGRDAGVMFVWRTKDFVDDIRPKKNPKRELPPEALMQFVGALKHLAESSTDPRAEGERIAYAFALTKLRTCLRNEELFDLRVEHVNLDTAVLANYVKKCKRSHDGQIKHDSAPMTTDVVDALAPLVEGRGPDEYVFQIRGRRLQATSLRKAIRKACRTAFYDAQRDKWAYPPFDTLAFLRHNVLTELMKSRDPLTVSRYAGHSSPAVTLRHYDLDPQALAVKREIAQLNTERFLLLPPDDVAIN